MSIYFARECLRSTSELVVISKNSMESQATTVARERTTKQQDCFKVSQYSIVKPHRRFASKYVLFFFPGQHKVVREEPQCRTFASMSEASMATWCSVSMHLGIRKLRLRGGDLPVQHCLQTAPSNYYYYYYEAVFPHRLNSELTSYKRYQSELALPDMEPHLRLLLSSYTAPTSNISNRIFAAYGLKHSRGGR